MAQISRQTVPLESGSKQGWLYQYHPTTVAPTGNVIGAADDAPVQQNNNKQQQGEGGDPDKGSSGRSALHLYFFTQEGSIFDCNVIYSPYFYVVPAEGHEREVELGLTGAFGDDILSVVTEEKEDLSMPNHLSGKARLLLKVSFDTTGQLTAVRQGVDAAMRRYAKQTQTGVAAGDAVPLDFSGGFVDLDRNPTLQMNPIGADAAGTASSSDGSKGDGKGKDSNNVADKFSWARHILDIREYDVKYYVRVAIDCDIFVGTWYNVTVESGEAHCTRVKEDMAPLVPRICAFDIETTKAPLRFPQPEVDQIYMISYMLDGKGYLIVNREVVSEDIEDFDYTPKPDYPGEFECYNVPDEAALLRKWFDHMREYRPMVYVTYNGDYFDFPFIQARSQVRGLDMRREIGFAQNAAAEGATLNLRVPHLDCFYWVKRDSYLPQGSHGLKAVTKYKLGYDPIEVDPEEMLPLAQNHPQRMAAYSVSDAVSTYYLYMKYVHPFIYSLCTIIPMAPDDVLRKGSGTICETLLCVQAYKKNVLFPNKQVSVREKFHNGHLIDRETYIGGRVEALKSGVYRSNLPMKFSMNPETLQMLSDKIEDDLKYAITVENGFKLEEITNFDEVRDEIRGKLAQLKEHPDFSDTPLIYHLDVGAMYPNIILTNRLQPPAMVSQEVCASCIFNSPDNIHNCKRTMHWMWRGELFTANRHEYMRIKAQLERESFAEEKVHAAEAATQQRKAYGNRRGNVLEGTAFEQKEENWGGGRGGRGGGGGFGRGGGGGGSGGSGGYRKGGHQPGMPPPSASNAPAAQQKSDSDASGSDSDDEDGGPKRFHNLKEAEQFALLKKRLGDYCRKAYRKTANIELSKKEATVCMRENPFFIDTVRLFRDRRYEYKAGLKKWKGALDAAAKVNDESKIKEAKARCVQMESLQLAHKCILNSFYGYVMRKGSRWYSMEMGGVVTYLGANLIQMARALVQEIGVTLELDTDGIWCCLPASFPENFVVKTNNPKKPKFEISYPCLMLNKDVADRNTNHQYQTPKMDGSGEYVTHSECSIAFEVDGPYLAMVLPASREEGKGIKKRYAVFNPNGSLAELKGFELKRRGELMLIKDFQSLVFKQFLKGSTLVEAYQSAGQIANDALDLLYSKGQGYEEEEVIAKLTESSSLSRRLADYPPNQKSLGLTTARRIAELLGSQMTKDKGLQCSFVISRLPHGRPVTDRAIPLVLFKAPPATRVEFLRRWTGDTSITSTSGLADLLDWEYYIVRMGSCIQKIITIPAALQLVPNPVPRVKHPDWLARVVAAQNAKFKQIKLDKFLHARKDSKQESLQMKKLADLEDIFDIGKITKETRVSGLIADKKKKKKNDDDNNCCDDDDDEDNLKNHDSDEDEISSNAESVDSVDRLEAQAQRQQELDEVQQRRKKISGFLRKNFPARPADRMVNAAVSTETEGFNQWFSSAREKWLSRAKTRDQMAQLGIGADVSPELAEAKTKAVSTPWTVLEIRPEPPKKDQPSYVRIFALLDRTMYSFKCAIDRTILVDLASPEAVVSLVNRFPELRTRITPINGKVLPRHHQAAYLIEVNLSRLPQTAVYELLRWLGSENESCLNVYEDHITETHLAIFKLGCSAEVSLSRHLTRIRERSQNKSLVARNSTVVEDFHLNELETLDNNNKRRLSYLTDVPLQNAFVFHVGSDANGVGGNRGLLGIFFSATRTATVVVVQPAQAQKQPIPFKTMIQEAAQLVGLGDDDHTHNIKIEYQADWAAAFGIINGEIQDAVSSKAIHVVVLHSAWKPAAFFERVQACRSAPVFRVNGALEDQTILTSGNPLTWTRDLSRRMLQRYFASSMWIADRADISRISGVPLCNVGFDGFISAWDTLFARALTSHGHVLWDPSKQGADDEPEERNTEAAAIGGYLSWSIELGVANIDVLSVIFSQTIQEADDYVASSMLETSGKLGSHFGLLRDVVSNLYSAAAQSNETAAIALQNFPRWLRCTASACYDSKLVSYVNSLVSRAQAAFLIRITQLGGKIVYANKNRVIISTPKHDPVEAMQFASYLITSLREAPLIRHMGPHVRRLWSCIAVQDVLNYVGSYMLPADVNQLINNGAGSGVATNSQQALIATQQQGGSSDELLHLSSNNLNSNDDAGNSQPQPKLRLDLNLPAIQTVASGAVAAKAMSRMFDLLQHIEQAKRTAISDIAKDKTVTLATRFEKLSTLIKKILLSRLSESFQPALLSDVNDLLVDDTLRHQLGGSHGAMKTLAATYASVVCAMMQRADETSPVPRRTLNNCLRLCGFSPYSSNFAAELWYAGTESQRVSILRFACGFCTSEIVLDLSQPKIQAQDQQQQQNHWLCPTCKNTISTSAIEEYCVKTVRRWISKINDQDFNCVRCHQSSASLLSHTCTCGGALVPRLTRADVITRLGRFLTVATLHNLPYLLETVNESFSDLVSPV